VSQLRSVEQYGGEYVTAGLSTELDSRDRSSVTWTTETSDDIITSPASRRTRPSFARSKLHWHVSFTSRLSVVITWCLIIFAGSL